MRKMVHTHVGTQAGAITLSSFQEIEIRRFLARLLRDPRRLMKEIRL